MVLLIRLRRLIMSGRLSGDFSMSIDTDRWKLRVTTPSTISLPGDKTWNGREVYKIQFQKKKKKTTTLFTVSRDEWIRTPAESQLWRCCKSASLQVSDCSSCLHATGASRLSRHLNSPTAQGPDVEDCSSPVDLPPLVLAKSNRNMAFSLNVKCRLSISSSLQWTAVPDSKKTYNVKCYFYTQFYILE